MVRIDFKTSPFNLRYSNAIHIKETGAGVTNDRVNIYFANFHFTLKRLCHTIGYFLKI